tara:strand:+ start:267 stop:566 length:300 start_codon:yes stop_codon:yes gene_type:complete
MKQNVTEYDFIDGFMKIRPDNFSRNGLQCLYDYLIEFENDIGEELEFDVIALCCEFSEYKDIKEINEAYGTDAPFEDIEELREHTQVIECDNSIIIQDY